MPIWRCPHCGTPQPEASRCWVCRRSTTTCATCRHFRRSVAASVGYCGLDRRRTPLRGDEIRPCWEAALDRPGAPEIGAPTRTDVPAPRFGFVPVDEGPSGTSPPVGGPDRRLGSTPAERSTGPTGVPALGAPGALDPVGTLWGDVEA